MSARALLKGVETRLRSAACLNDPDGKVSGVQPDGRPPGGAGQIYHAIHWLGSSSEFDNPQGQIVAHMIGVTTTVRLGYAPRDRRGQVITTPTELLDIAELIAGPGIVHGSYEVLAAANVLIPGTAEYVAAHGGSATKNGFQEPLLLLDYGPVNEVSAEWVGASEGKDIYTVVVRFGRARRAQLT
jgi:hypothetical protein